MKNTKSKKAFVGALAILGAMALSGAALANSHTSAPPGTPPNPEGPVVFVNSQGLSFDSLELTPLPPEGPFQRLYMDPDHGSRLTTDFGPGDVGYLGGRWWLDLNNNEMVDMGEPFFSCPLVGPGYNA